MFEQSLALKKQHRDFRSDMSLLLTPQVDWHFESALHLVEQAYMPKLKGNSWRK